MTGGVLRMARRGLRRTGMGLRRTRKGLWMTRKGVRMTGGGQDGAWCGDGTADFAGGGIGPADEAEVAGGEEEEAVVGGLGVGDEEGGEGAGAGLAGEPGEVQVSEDVGVMSEEGGRSFDRLRMTRRGRRMTGRRLRMTGGRLRMTGRGRRITGRGRRMTGGHRLTGRRPRIESGMRGRGVQQGAGEADAAAGLEGLGTGLAGDANVKARNGLRVEEFLDAFRFVTGVYDHFGEAGFAKAQQHPFEHGHAAHLHHRFWNVPGDFPEPRAQARRKNKSFHVTKIIIIFA